MSDEEFRVHSTAGKCVYLPLNHELEVSKPFNIQTGAAQSYALKFVKCPERRKEAINA